MKASRGSDGSAPSNPRRRSKAKALAVLSSDALSSVAYATEEILRVLLLAGGSFLQPSMLGKLRYGSKLVNLVADATSDGGGCCWLPGSGILAEACGRRFIDENRLGFVALVSAAAAAAAACASNKKR